MLGAPTDKFAGSRAHITSNACPLLDAVRPDGGRDAVSRWVIGEAGDVASARTGIRAARPDVAVLDEHAMLDTILAEAGGCVVENTKGWNWPRRSRSAGPAAELRDL